MRDNASLRRNRDLGAIINDSFSILFAHFGAFAGIVFPAAVTSLALSLVAFAVEDGALLLLVLLVSVLVNFLVFEFVRSAGVVYLDGLEQQDRIPSAESLDRAQQRLSVISGAAIRSALIVLGLSITVIGLPFAINRIVRWAFLPQVIMLEDRRGEDVLATSAEMVAGHWWSTAGRLLVTGLIVGVPTLIVSGLVGAVSPLLGVFVDAAIVFLTTPYGIISTTLMYYDLRPRPVPHLRGEASPV